MGDQEPEEWSKKLEKTEMKEADTPTLTPSVLRPVEECVEDGKNKFALRCLHCPSKILEPSTASFHTEDKSLPKMSQKKDRTELEVDAVSEWFVVEDVMMFDNIGVSHAVENTKYLTCADCEMGPVGWTDLANKKCYVALSRVKQC